MGIFTDAEIEFITDALLSDITKPVSRNETPKLWIDSSDRSHLVVCDLCNLTDGPYESYPSASKALTVHRAEHPAQRLPGRPRSPLSECLEDGCTKRPVARNMCDSHYRLARRRERS